MSTRSWEMAILLAAIVFATIRPMVACDGQIESCLFGRCGESESEEEREGERDSEPEQDVSVDGQKTRRIANSIRKVDASLHFVRCAAHSKLAMIVDSPSASTTSEHAFRFGVGAPLRI